MRAAMVGGVAYHAGKKVQEGRDADYERDARMDEMEEQQAAPPPAAAPQTDVVTQLEKLGQLKQQGILTDAEFEVQKQKILQGMS